jgi:cytochrome P450
VTAQLEGAVRPSFDLFTYEDLLYVLRSKVFEPLNEDSGFNHQYQMMFTGGALIDLHGEDHFERRRLLSELFRRATLDEYERDYLLPAVLTAIEESQIDGNVDTQVDLLTFTWHIMMRLMVRLIGVDALTTKEDEDRFEAYFRDFEHGARSRYNQDPAPVAARGLVARSRIISEFLDPSW